MPSAPGERREQATWRIRSFSKWPVFNAPRGGRFWAPVDNPNDLPYDVQITACIVHINDGSIEIGVKRSADLLLSKENLVNWSSGYPEGRSWSWQRTVPIGTLAYFRSGNVVHETVAIDAAGFYVGSCAHGGPSGSWVQFNTFVLAVPLWACMVVLLILPVAWVRARLDRVARAGRCQICGYDLTGNTSGTCPECGTPVPKVHDEKSPRPA
ncbi:MAG TPA: hypothetical protein VK797_31080 [Tepidisphaeraceae bacterium]|nr:hypothetical protein [Tepidisphaeraceae bacterium]